MSRRTSSPATLARQTQQAEWARVWHSLTPVQRNGFQTLALQTTPLRKDGKPRMTAFFFFATLNTALTNAGRQPITSPPASIVYPPSIGGPLILTSTATPGHFSLFLSAPAYANSVIVYGAPPVMAGTDIYHDNSFRVIGSLPSLTSSAQDIAEMYAEAFRAPQDGEKVAIKLVGVSSTGSATTKFFVASVTSSLAASLTESDDTNLEMAA